MVATQNLPTLKFGTLTPSNVFSAHLKLWTSDSGDAWAPAAMAILRELQKYSI